MFIQPDHTYRDIQEKSFQQWLDEMEQHEDLAVSGGVKLAREYVQYLKDEIKQSGRIQSAGPKLQGLYEKTEKRQITIGATD